MRLRQEPCGGGLGQAFATVCIERKTLTNGLVSMSERVTTLAGLSNEQRDTIRRIAEKHGAQHVHVFGSVAHHGEAGPQSNLDLLIDKGAETTPWFPAGLILELEEFLGRDVDVVTEKGLNADLRERILQEAIPL